MDKSYGINEKKILQVQGVSCDFLNTIDCSSSRSVLVKMNFKANKKALHLSKNKMNSPHNFSTKVVIKLKRNTAISRTVTWVTQITRLQYFSFDPKHEKTALHSEKIIINRPNKFLTKIVIKLKRNIAISRKVTWFLFKWKLDFNDAIISNLMHDN